MPSEAHVGAAALGRLSLRGRARAPVSPPLGHYCSRGRYGIDSERESIDLAHDDAFSGGNGDGGDGVPKLAVHEHFSGGGERGLRDSDFAD